MCFFVVKKFRKNDTGSILMQLEKFFFTKLYLRFLSNATFFFDKSLTLFHGRLSSMIVSFIFHSFDQYMCLIFLRLLFRPC